MDPLLVYVRASCPEPLPTDDLNLVVSLCRLLESYLVPKMDSPLMDEESGRKTVEMVFASCVMWSLGATCATEHHAAFDSFFCDLLSDAEIDLLIPSHGAAGTLYDVFFNWETGSFVPWAAALPKFTNEGILKHFNLCH